MDEQVQTLVRHTKELLDYIDSAHVFDKLADAGCGLYDEYRSDTFEALINQVKEALKPFGRD